MSDLISFIIPSRNERFLANTIDDIFRNATGPIEVYAVLDGYWCDPPLKDRPGLHVLHWGKSHGMRASINAAAALAKGKYLAKVDAHCSFEYGFDEVLKKDIDSDWVVIPRRDRLDAENWCLQKTGKPPIDLYYLSCPITNPDGYSMHGHVWPERDKQRLHITIDETMSTQGSFWMMHRTWFDNFLGGLSEEGYGGFAQEFQEIGNKTWLGGGKVFTNKATTYLHLHKSKTYGRMYPINRSEIKNGHYYSARYWMSNSWEKRIHDIEWLVEKFNPPGWPADWQARRFEYVRLDF